MQIKLLMIFFLSYQTADCQARMCLEEYYYTGYSGSSAWVSRASYQSDKGWYGEVRYNYDAARSYSLYGGRTFSKQADLSWSFTPFGGLVMGEWKGASTGANMTLNRGKFIFSSTSQYTFSAEDGRGNFFFTWSELGFQTFTHVYAGLALQETHNILAGDKWEPGVQIGITYKEWTFPVYVFDPIGGKRYFVLGAVWEKK